MGGWVINSIERLRTLRSFGLIDTGREAMFDEVAQEAATLVGAPVALVSLLEAERQWFKAKVGTDVSETPIEIAICGHTLAHGDTLVIPDLAEDRRTRFNPLVTEPPKVRFYAGTPIVTFGQAIGTVCVLDTVPHPAGLTDEQRTGLERLAASLSQSIATRVRGR